MTAPDYTKSYVCHLRLDEIMEERGIPDAVELSRITGIHYNVLRRMQTGQTKGIDFVNILRLCMGLRVSPDQLFVIDPINDENAPTDA